MTDKPTYRATPADYAHLPTELKNYPYWCLWKYESRGNKDWTKIPYSAHGGMTSSNKPSTFDNFSRVFSVLERRAGRYNGVGIGVFGDIVALDIDHCIAEDGCFNEVAEAIVEKLDSYSELSPSHCGLRIIVTCPGFTYDKAEYYVNRHGVLEFYAASVTDKFVSITGNSLDDPPKPVREVSPETLMQILDQYMRRSTVRTKTAAEVPEELSEDELALEVAEVMNRMRRGSNWEKARILLDGESPSGDVSADDQALCNILAFYSQKNSQVIDAIFRQSGRYRNKWCEQRGALTYGEMTIKRAIDDCQQVWSPSYRTIPTGDVAAALAWLQEHDVAHNRRYTHDDIGAGYLLADYMKPFARYVPEKKNWRYFTGVYWRDDTGGKKVAETAKDMSRALTAYAAASHEDKDFQEFIKWAGVWSKASSRRTFIEEASSVHCVSASGFDNDSWLLNLNNGTLDLRTLELHEHNPDDLITQLAPVDYDPSATCPRWDTFISEIMEPSDDEADGRDKSTVGAEKAAFLQTYLGYCLTGDTSAEAFLVMYGPTSRNGKSVCVEAVRNILGTYSRTVNAETLLQAKRDGRGPSEDIARLCGVRMASVGELPQGSKLDAALIKYLTGGDTLNARYLGENSFDYRPQFKLLLHTNHLPACSDMSVFNSGRAQVLPFSRHFEEWEQDRNLKRLFREPQNQSAILNWMIQGLRKYREKGLHAPAAVKAATAEYRKDGDKVARFIEERLRKSYESMERVSLVYAAYKLWCQHEGVYPESSRQFRQRIIGAGIVIANRRPTSGENPTDVIVGYSLCSDFDDLKDAS